MLAGAPASPLKALASMGLGTAAFLRCVVLCCVFFLVIDVRGVWVFCFVVAEGRQTAARVDRGYASCGEKLSREI